MNTVINFMFKKIFRMGKQKFAIIILCIMLIASLSYIGVIKYEQNQQVRFQQAYLQGYNQGISDVVSGLYQQTNTCQAVNIFMGNLSKQVIDIGCLQK